MTLAAQLFTSILPLFIVIGTIPQLHQVADTLTQSVGFDVAEAAGTSLQWSIDTPTNASFGVVGILMTVISATSFARALGRAYGHIWSAPKVPAREGWRWLVVLAAVAGAATIAIQAQQLRTIDGPAGDALALGAEFIVWSVLWSTTPHLLVKTRLSIRILCATGLLTATGLLALRIASNVALSDVAARALHKFGVLGLVFTTIGWLFVFSAIVVAGSTIISSLSRDEGALGAFLRSDLTRAG